MVKSKAKFYENCRNHGKDMASDHRPKDHYKTQHLALKIIIMCSARFSSAKCCHCRALTKVFWLTLHSASAVKTYFYDEVTVMYSAGK